MTETTDKKIEFKNKIIEFYDSNKLKLYLLALVILIFIAVMFYIKYSNEKKNILISEKYTQASIYLASDKKDEAKKIYEEIILDKNDFYSILALNNLLEKKLTTDKNKIIEYFDILIKSVSKKDHRDLLNLKKALFLIKSSENQKGYKLLENLVKDNSTLRPIAEQLLEK